MAFDPVPLAIGGGAQHTDEVWRSFANAATRDSQGINLPGDLKVTSGGAGVATIAPGAAIIRNAQAPGQSYVGRAGTPTNYPYPSNVGGAGVTRHLLIARIIDPDFAPWQPSGSPGAPNTSVANGPYFEPFLVSGVASGVTRASQVVSYSALALARIDMAAGASTGTFVDCREMAQPRVGFAFDVQKVPAVDTLTTAQTTYRDFTTSSLQVYIPRWATHAQVSIDILSLNAGIANADFRANLAGTAGTDVPFDNAASAGQLERVPFAVYAEFDVRAVQDSVTTLKLQARRTTVANTGTLNADTRTLLKYDVKFSERVV